MLAAKRLPLILRSSLTSDLEAVCLLTSEGSLLSSAFLSTKSSKEPITDEVTLAAVATSVWAHYVQVGSSEIFFHLIKLENDLFFGITSVGKSYLLAAVGRAPGLVRCRLQQLAQYFVKVFEPLK